MATPEIDDVTGVETTGHEWDGLKELNKPLPRWWLWVLYATIIWSVGYWIVMPAWPLLSDYTKGLFGYSQRAVVAKSLENARAAQAHYLERIGAATLAEIKADPELLEFSLAGGAAAFGDNCAPCHGRGAQGGPGYPNLNDDDWLWGGTLEDIHTTLRVGIRSTHPDTRDSQMPAFGRDQILDTRQIADVADYVLSLSGQKGDAAAAKRGAAIFAEQCAACHGEDGKGNRELGAPNLTDRIWLYGGSRDAIIESVTNSRRGVMPTWEGRLSAETIKQLAVYVHSLGGGE
ncbi:MAG: cytochrome-c oxidase, cbb3-type subunit III [Alphaproteobacteria bacterium]|nr:MAG: cytochrome-c oxidase, cbb3-type subunit III [Alphaproteobacteria bacterium]